MLKSIGYSISSLSVMLLGLVSWDGVKDKPVLVACLIAGMITSVVGMICRWTAYLHEQAEKRREEPQSRLSPRPADGRAGAARTGGLDRAAAR